MNYGFFRIACASPSVVVGGCTENVNEIISAVKKADNDNVQLLVFPELCITSYTCSDLFLQNSLIEKAWQSVIDLAESVKRTSVLFVIGCPIKYGNKLFNCAIWIKSGKILAIVPKTNIPNYSEFYEVRHFTSASILPKNLSITLDSYNDTIPFGTDILVSCDGVLIGTEICEDLWVPSSPSVNHCLQGALIIANLSASNEVVGKAAYRRMLVQSQSAKLCCAYAYCDAGNGESTTDMIFSSHNMIAENGTLLSESPMYTNSYIISDIDIQRLTHERQKMNTYPFSSPENSNYRIVKDDDKQSKKKWSKDNSLYRTIEPYPFVPTDKDQRDERCKEIISMQAEGLAKRLRHTRCQKAVVGLSGGLDSTLALLVIYEAFKRTGLEFEGIIAVTMPCFGTTDRTYKNACNLAKSLGVTLKEIRIEKAVRQHFSDIGQDERVHDVTYENSQARERTQILMDIANQQNGLVIGTGDLSELALGWATYNGDHMSMYAVNTSIPKTLVRYLVQWFSDKIKGPVSDVLKDILVTPVSPELLPPENGVISQKTEELVGPYDLHDFFLYYMIRWGFSVEKIQYLAYQAFELQQKNNGKEVLFSKDTIDKWIKIFIKRFYSQQFKRSCIPDGAKVGTVSLSPRGDWRMPSDAVFN